MMTAWKPRPQLVTSLAPHPHLLLRQGMCHAQARSVATALMYRICKVFGCKLCPCPAGLQPSVKIPTVMLL
jgi:hypothetical protein